MCNFYNLFGNLIAEQRLDGSYLREWIYLGGQRLALIVPVTGGVRWCALAGGADGGAVFLGFMGLIFVGIGLRYRNRKYTIAGLKFLSGVLKLVLMPEARSQTPTENIYYYHNDHLGTPRVLTDDQGAVVGDVDYKPFGEISSSLASSLN